MLSGEVEADEVYVVAGHKGHPEAAKYAHNEDGNGFHEIHVNTIEGV